ncbi:MAG: hypothetical protein KDI63_00780 [Gammaproteobacteria bacterium]|nr:hypothetical protein [Gammaproteobacteria bacterium]
MRSPGDKNGSQENNSKKDYRQDSSWQNTNHIEHGVDTTPKTGHQEASHTIEGYRQESIRGKKSRVEEEGCVSNRHREESTRGNQKKGSDEKAGRSIKDDRQEGIFGKENRNNQEKSSG